MLILPGRSPKCWSSGQGRPSFSTNGSIRRPSAASGSTSAISSSTGRSAGLCRTCGEASSHPTNGDRTMQIRTDEISSIIRQQIESFDVDLRVDEVGTVLEVGDGIARAYGLEKAMASEMVEFENGSFGLALNLEEDSVGIVILGGYLDIREGQTVKRTGRVLSVPAGEALIGRAVTAIGEPLDGKGPNVASAQMPLESKAPGIADRQGVNEPLQTGIKSVDAMIPIGRGQRELIIGDRETGK